MVLNDLIFFVFQPPGFIQNGFGNANFPTVVQNRGPLEYLLALFVQAKFLCHEKGIPTDSLRVATGIIVLGLDGEDQ